MSREFCLEQVARIDKLEQAVAEIQDKLALRILDGGLDLRYNYSIQSARSDVEPPPAEQDKPEGENVLQQLSHIKPPEDKCKIGRHWDSGNGLCQREGGCNKECCNHSAYEPKVCKTCGGSGRIEHYYSTNQKEFGGDGSYVSEYPCPSCQPKADKKYYCLCGKLLEVLNDNFGWWIRCPNESAGVLHVATFRHHTEALLLAELDKLPPMGQAKGEAGK